MVNSQIEYAWKFTNEYEKYRNENVSLREAAVLEVQYPAILQPIQTGDLFAGRIKMELVGFSPKDQDSFGYYCREKELSGYLDSEDLLPEQKEHIETLVEIWKKENGKNKVRERFTKKQLESLPTDDLMVPGIAFPLYRMTGWVLNYNKLVKLGISGLEEEVRQLQSGLKERSEEYLFYEGSLRVLAVFRNCANYYVQEIQQEIGAVQNAERRKELEEMKACLIAIQTGPPQTLREGIQLVWLYSLLAYTLDYGRVDDYLSDLYEEDMHRGAITREDAFGYLKSLWVLMADMATAVHGRVVIGGRGRHNEEWADKLAILAMEASKEVERIEPQLSLRVYQGMNKELWDKAFEVLEKGRTYPILYNDDVNIPSVAKAMKVSEKEALDYYPFGCGEYVLAHKSFGTPNGVMNLLQAVLIALEEQKAGEAFEELYLRYLEICKKNIQALTLLEKQAYDVAGQEGSYLFQSMLYDGCLEKGKGIFQGGIPYLSGTLETYGNISASDSLYAIKHLVYEQKSLGLDDLRTALHHNFEGFMEEWNKMKKVPKFGNDKEAVDKMAERMHEDICELIRVAGEENGLHSFLAVLINNDHNVKLGISTEASPDGRRKGAPLSNGNSPTAGNDQTGLTAVMNSVTRLRTDIHAGGVTNFKLSRTLIKQHGENVKNLFGAFFQNGGQQAMISVLNKEDLIQAMEKPEEYSHIFVRVGGYSARFIKLPREVQQDIANRTLYE